MYEILEFDIIIRKLAEYALSDNVKDKIHKLNPYMDEAKVIAKIEETTEAKEIIVKYGNPPTVPMVTLSKNIKDIEAGKILSPEQLFSIKQFLTACRRMQNYLHKAEDSKVQLSLIGRSIKVIMELEDEIDNSIRSNTVYYKATNELFNLHKKVDSLGIKIKDKLNSILQTKKTYFSESFIVTRSGHYTLPVKKEFAKKIEGINYDVSKSGNTVFIEPASINRFSEKLLKLDIEKENEIRKILSVLTIKCADYLTDIIMNMKIMENLDFIFAKAKLSISMNATPPIINTNKYINIINGRHPLLDVKEVIPLNIEFGNKERSALIITGPNTGGKTVTLKTVGLFSLMSQSGLHVPAKECNMCLVNAVLCDIGDGQSISENLSTFSSHMKNIIEILNNADDQSLVLLDELGSGTDPAEGMGLAVAILEKLKSSNCLLIATTHYPEIKNFAKQTYGFVNAKMAFDRENLLPLYKLEIGEAGESCALYIASRLGLDKTLIDRAYQVTYDNKKESDVIEISKSDITYSNYKKNKIRIRKISNKKDSTKEVISKFNIGDCVRVSPNNEIGIIFKGANDKGIVGVQIKKVKTYINHKRLELYINANELYPDEYDFNIVFDSVENRKAKKKMSKRHVADIVVSYDD